MMVHMNNTRSVTAVAIERRLDIPVANLAVCSGISVQLSEMTVLWSEHFVALRSIELVHLLLNWVTSTVVVADMVRHILQFM
jgi:hypothetical protein